MNNILHHPSFNSLTFDGIVSISIFVTFDGIEMLSNNEFEKASFSIARILESFEN